MLVAVTPAGIARADADLFDEIYRRGSPMNARLRSLSASFVETTSSTLLARPLVARGRVVAERPSSVRLTYEAPDERVVVVHEGRMTMDWPSRDIHESRDVRPSLQRAERLLSDTSPAALRKQFDIDARVAPDREGTWHVSLVPKRRQMREGLERLHLWIDQDTLLLQALRMELPGGDARLMEFSDIVVNPPLAPGVFTPPAPR